jgi:hypothetical protein
MSWGAGYLNTQRAHLFGALLPLLPQSLLKNSDVHATNVKVLVMCLFVRGS